MPLIALFAASVVVGCVTPRFAPGSWCPRSAPAGMPSFERERARDLAGIYELMLVGDNETSRGQPRTGRLTLWVQDSARQVRSNFGRLPAGRERVLGAAFEEVPRDTSTGWREVASRDLDHPGGIYAAGKLRLGGYEGFDGTGDDLFIEHASPEGFRGRWRSDLGIAIILDGRGGTLPNPAGFFCARRPSAAAR